VLRGGAAQADVGGHAIPAQTALLSPVERVALKPVSRE